MRAVLQRVSAAQVRIDGEPIAQIGTGILVLLGVEVGDGPLQAQFLSEKIAHLRIFEDEAGKMNLSVLDIGGEVLVVSNFTLCTDCDKGRRPSFQNSADPQCANDLYEQFVALLLQKLSGRVHCGRFGAQMLVELQNDGPVTLILDTEKIMPKGR